MQPVAEERIVGNANRDQRRDFGRHRTGERGGDRCHDCIGGGRAAADLERTQCFEVDVDVASRVVDSELDQRRARSGDAELRCEQLGPVFATVALALPFTTPLTLY